ncbi:MAG TPA: VCBS repeat-containing protein [Rhizomicrobium sp.]|nr:VCBS repeat-containing protein [Rhizomicrobium sp.]
MEAGSQSQRLFLARLAIGLAQGLVLYLLYSAGEAKTWPATQGTVFVPLLLVSLAAPVGLILSLGAMSCRKALTWVGIASALVALLGFFDSWMGASQVFDIEIPSAQLVLFGAGGLFIAHALVTGGVTDRRFMASYPTHFDVAWKLAVQLALSILFVGAFWLLLWLGAGLFGLVKLDFFEKLLQHAWFSIPVLSVAAAGALHLTDIRPVLVQGARTLLLTLLSWLLPLITMIVGGFVATLPFTGLGALWSIGHATALLLAAAAVLIVLINAAYQDGVPERMPPKILRLAGTVAAILTVPLTLIAAYALFLRVHQYGWSVDRVTVAAIILVALAYAGGYARAALMQGPWLARIESWNFHVSLLALALMIALFTPLASPARIAVADQMARLKEGRISPANFDFRYLRWHGGRYGLTALNDLKRSANATVRDGASAALLEKNPHTPGPSLSWPQNVKVYPAGQKLPRDFVETPWDRVSCRVANVGACQAVLADFDGDGQQDILIFPAKGGTGQIFIRKSDGAWHQKGRIEIPLRCSGLLAALQEGRFKISPEAHPLSRFEAAGVSLHIAPVPDSEPSCPK